MPTLHTVNQSPFLSDALASCVRLSRPGSGILLMEDAVLACLVGSDAVALIEQALCSRSMYVLGEDLSARGVPAARVRDGVEVVDYTGFVDLCTRYGKVQAWF